MMIGRSAVQILWRLDRTIGSIWSNIGSDTLTHNLTRPGHIADMVHDLASDHTWRLVSDSVIYNPEQT